MQKFWQKWLSVLCCGVSLFGLIFAGGVSELTSGPLDLLYKALSPEVAVQLDQANRFSMGTLGTITIRWGIILFGAVRGAIALGEDGAKLWKWILVSVVTWFAVDCFMSVLTAFYSNLILNIVLLIGVFLPVWRMGILRLRLPN
jgi:hypothetical protein